MSAQVQFKGMPPTAKVYHHDQYATTCEAQVLAVDGRFVVFDRSIFYAESGGQVSDQGTVSGRRVVDVQKAGGTPHYLPNGDFLNVNTYFVHEFEDDVDLEVGDRVTMEIDWDRRYRNMQMHTLAHFLFHAIGEHLAREGQDAFTKGCYISDSSARFDFGTAIDGSVTPELEDRVRGLVEQGEDATVTEVPDTDDVYLWSCSGIEIPCGGTHVHSAREIEGDIHVRRRSKGRSGTRVYVTLDRPGEQPGA